MAGAIGGIRWNDARLRATLDGPAGPVARELIRRGIRVTNQARKNASGRPGPNVDTGRLRSSIAMEVGQERAQFVVYVGTNVDYGRYLEFGTSRMPAYPWLLPALEAF